MSWKFWEEEKEVEKEKVYPVGSFLFATGLNNLGVLSVEREKDHTEVVFRDGKGNYAHNSFHHYAITYEQHEDFIKKLSQEIKCIVTPGV